MASLIPEDGTGLTNANAFASVGEVDTYVDHHDQNAVWVAASTAAKEKAIRLATQYLETFYTTRWLGRRVYQNQALAWPRYGVYDNDYIPVDSASVPRQVKAATAELAVRSINGTILVPDIEQAGGIESTRIRVDVIEEEIEYAGARSNYTRYDAVERILWPLIESATEAERG